MAEEKKEKKQEQEKETKKTIITKEKKHEKHDEKKEVAGAHSLIRIAGTDIPGEKDTLSGLTRIKGVSWSMSNALCTSLGIDKKRKMLSLNEQEIEKITNFLKKPSTPMFLFNRRRDREKGESTHLITTDLELQKDFDIRRHKKIRTYKGLRHALGLPVRGQRTRSHFRKGRAIGVQKSKAMSQPKAGEEKKSKGK